MGDEGEIRVFNPSKEISKEIILEVLMRHRDSMKQARTGEIPNLEEVKKIEDNDRKFNQVRALNLIIAAQREMITLSRPVINFRSQQKWKKSHKSEEDKDKVPFKEHKNDFNDLMEILNQLKYFKTCIKTAEETKSFKDDFIIKKESSTDAVINYQLTDNFEDMMDELEDTYQQIYLLMLINKIVSAGIEEDEELTYKQKEKEAINRVIEA